MQKVKKYEGNKHPYKTKILITACCCYVYLVAGLTIIIPPTSSIDIAYLVDSSEEEVATGLTLKQIAYTVGSITS